MLNNWRDLIQQQESLSKQAEFNIRDARQKGLVERQKRLGFKAGISRVLIEQVPEGETVSRDDDSRMIPIKKVNKHHYKHEGVKRFIEAKEENLRKKIETHNLQNLQVIGDDAKGFEDDDLGAEVVDERIHKQIESMINKGSKKIKKGSDTYLNWEIADNARVKETFVSLKKKQKRIM